MWQPSALVLDPRFWPKCVVMADIDCSSGSHSCGMKLRNKSSSYSCKNKYREGNFHPPSKSSILQDHRYMAKYLEQKNLAFMMHDLEEQYRYMVNRESSKPQITAAHSNVTLLVLALNHNVTDFIMYDLRGTARVYFVQTSSSPYSRKKKLEFLGRSSERWKKCVYCKPLHRLPRGEARARTTTYMPQLT